MYEKFYGLQDKPFSLLPDSDFLFLSKHHRMAVNLLEYGMLTQAGFIVISGEVGTGKTTVIRHYLRSIGPDTVVGVITNSSKALGELLSRVASAFNLDYGTRNKLKLYDSFVDFLLARYAEGRRTVLIIDEAQNLGMKALEDLRMLSNVNNEKDQILQIILAGQPELLSTLRKPRLRQFVQRIAVHCNLELLDAAETTAYIRHRLAVVGGASDLFSDDACAAVHYFTAGTPRLINMLCDISLVYAFSDERQQIKMDTIVEVARERNQAGLSPFRVEPERDDHPDGLLLYMATALADEQKHAQMCATPS